MTKRAIHQVGERKEIGHGHYRCAGICGTIIPIRCTLGCESGSGKPVTCKRCLAARKGKK